MNGGVYAQTFTVGTGGILSAVDLGLTAGPDADLLSPASRLLNFAIMSTSGGVPSSVLFSTTIDSGLLPTLPFFVAVPATTVDVSSAAISVNAGDVLAIRLFGGGANPNDWTIWATNDTGALPDAYTGGSPFQNIGVWQQLAFRDLSFRTYVDQASTPTAPEPTSLALMSLGGLGMLGGWYRKRRQTLTAVA